MKNYLNAGHVFNVDILLDLDTGSVIIEPSYMYKSYVASKRFYNFSTSANAGFNQIKDQDNFNLIHICEKLSTATKRVPMFPARAIQQTTDLAAPLGSMAYNHNLNGMNPGFHLQSIHCDQIELIGKDQRACFSGYNMVSLPNILLTNELSPTSGKGYACFIKGSFSVDPTIYAGGVNTTKSLAPTVYVPPTPMQPGTLTLTLSPITAGDATQYVSMIDYSIASNLVPLVGEIENSTFHFINLDVNGDLTSESHEPCWTWFSPSGLYSDIITKRVLYPNNDCFMAPNPFYLVANKDGSCTKAWEMPSINLGGFNHLISPIDPGKAGLDTGFVAVGGMLSKVSHCRFEDTNTPIAITSVAKQPAVSTAYQPTATFSNGKFTGHTILMSGAEYKHTPVPYLDQAASPYIYSFDSTSLQMKMIGTLPEPVYGAAVAVMSQTKLLVIGGINSCPEDKTSWINMPISNRVYLITIDTNKDLISVVQLANTIYPHLFASTCVVDNERVLILSGNHCEVYNTATGSIQQGTLAGGARYGACLHGYVKNGVSLYSISGGWEYTQLPFASKANVINGANFTDEYRARIKGKLTRGGVEEVADGANYLLSLFDPTQETATANWQTIPVLNNNTIDTNQDIYYQIDYLIPTVATGYSFRTGSVNKNEISGIASWAVYGSNDGTNFTQLDLQSDAVYDNHGNVHYNGVSYWQDFIKINKTFSNTIGYRYYRFYIFKTYQSIGTEMIGFHDLEFNIKSLQSIVPIRYVGDAEGGTLWPVAGGAAELHAADQVLIDGWWKPNLEFNHDWRVTKTSPGNTSYKFNSSAVMWNENIEYISGLSTLNADISFSVNATTITKGDDLIFTLNVSPTEIKEAYISYNGSQMSKIAGGSYTQDSTILPLGINTFKLYIYKTDNLTYEQNITITVNAAAVVPFPFDQALLLSDFTTLDFISPTWSQTISGELTNGDTDYEDWGVYMKSFKFEVPAFTKMTLTTDNSDTSGLFIFVAKDPTDTTTPTTWSSYLDNDGLLPDAILTPGTYYLSIFGNTDYDSVGPYEITLTTINQLTLMAASELPFSINNSSTSTTATIGETISIQADLIDATLVLLHPLVDATPALTANLGLETVDISINYPVAIQGAPTTLGDIPNYLYVETPGFNILYGPVYTDVSDALGGGGI